ncbi:MAG: polysaccharide deacetylase family protein [Chloroflexota bacterium]
MQRRFAFALVPLLALALAMSLGQTPDLTYLATFLGGGQSPRTTATVTGAAPDATATAARPSPTPTTIPTATAVPTPVPTPTATPTPRPLGSAWGQIRPNTLGKIMILEYHLIGPEEERWTRSYDNFWQDLELLYSRGYRPINARDLVENNSDVPAGTSPVVLTFDDSSPRQARFLKDAAGRWQSDPQSALGILERFHALHPDWALKGTFFVLPGADPPHDLFGQDEATQAKLRYLVDQGFELGNHTFWHMRLDQLQSKAEVDEQLGKAVQAVQRLVPGYDLKVLALPLGMDPRVPTWHHAGTYEDVKYRNEAIFLATGGPAASPYSQEFDRYAIPRIQATSFELDWRDAYLDYFDRHPAERYVSAGDPRLVVFPRQLSEQLRAQPEAQKVLLTEAVSRDYEAYRLP